MTDLLTRRQLMRSGATLGLGVALAGVGACSSPSGQPAAARHRRRRRPNVIVVTADDMRSDELPAMANVGRLLLAEGTNFTAARHNVALCSPARAGFLTGQLAQRHHIRSQRDSFARYNDVHHTLAVWMQDAGYHTGIVGKYFTEAEGRSSPPGWDVHRQLADKNQEQYGYRVWDGHELLAPKVDQTRYLQQEVVRFLDQAPQPFFLWFTPTADHSPFQAPPTHEHDPVPVLADHREGDVADKPPWIQHLAAIGDDEQASIRRSETVRFRELLGLDDTVGAIVRTLRSAGRLDDTVIIFTSDNGLLLGEHRVPPFTKNMPYEETVRSPCIVRGAGFPHGAVTQPVQLSVDLTATCVAVAGAEPNHPLDGVSLTDIVAHRSHYDDRELLYERDPRDGFTFGAQGPPAGHGVFTRTRKLIRWDDPSRTVELYDLETDPGELTNLAGDPARAEERAALTAALDRLLTHQAS